MEYNSQRTKLIIPEYGRHIQKMIEFAIMVEDREKRNKMAKNIVGIMGQLNPHLRDSTDFKQKLWDHLFIISDFKLDVDSPYPIPSRDTLDIKPQRISYPAHDIKFKHYGKIIELIINEIVKMKDGQQKESIVENMANFMKMVYLNWNRDTVNDELIFEHLKILSGGKLEVKQNAQLNHTDELLAKSSKKQIDSKKGKSIRQKTENGRKRERERKGR